MSSPPSTSAPAAPSTSSTPSTPAITNQTHLRILSQIAAGTTTAYTMMWGRTGPYAPTRQIGGHFPKWRGKTPAGVTDSIYEKAYNYAHCKVYEQFGGRSGVTNERAKVVLWHALRNGAIRDRALHILWKRGLIAADFIDNDY